MLKNEIKYYNKCVTAPKMETERGVIAYYICKWLDGNEQSVVSLGVVHPDEQETQKSYTLWVSLFVPTMDICILYVYKITYMKENCMRNRRFGRVNLL